MTLIYEPRGQAREYAALACNVYRGCDHRCAYCYGPSTTYRTREVFASPQNRNGNFLQSLRNEAKRRWLAGIGGQVLLSFTCDPYQSFDVKHQITRQAIEILHERNHSVCVLTKGGFRALRDIDLLTPADTFATTLTCLSESESLKWEPGAATPDERLYTLHTFHEAGIPTWVSLEPVLDPDVALQIIRETHTFVGHFKVGKLNYHPLAKTIDWYKFAADVLELLTKLDCRYYIKESLFNYMPAGFACSNFETVEARRVKLQPALL